MDGPTYRYLVLHGATVAVMFAYTLRGGFSNAVYLTMRKAGTESYGFARTAFAYVLLTLVLSPITVLVAAIEWVQRMTESRFDGWLAGVVLVSLAAWICR